LNVDEFPFIDEVWPYYLYTIGLTLEIATSL